MRVLVTAGCLALAAAGGPVRAAAQLDQGIAVGSKAPVIAVKDLDGKAVDLGQYLGRKPVVLVFWATWCPVCRDLMPALAAVRNTWGDGVELIGINITVNDSRERVRRYLARHEPPYDLVLYDTDGVSSRAYDVPTTSFTVIVDQGGTVVYTGSGEDQDLVSALRKAVGS